MFTLIKWCSNFRKSSPAKCESGENDELNDEMRSKFITFSTQPVTDAKTKNGITLKKLNDESSRLDCLVESLPNQSNSNNNEKFLDITSDNSKMNYDKAESIEMNCNSSHL